MGRICMDYVSPHPSPLPGQRLQIGLEWTVQRHGSAQGAVEIFDSFCYVVDDRASVAKARQPA